MDGEAKGGPHQILRLPIKYAEESSVHEDHALSSEVKRCLREVGISDK